MTLPSACEMPSFDQKENSWDSVLPWWLVPPDSGRRRMSKQLRRPASQYLVTRGVRLFRDDIEELIDLLKARSLEVTLSDPTYQYETLQEVIDARGIKPRELSCEGKMADNGPHRSVTISINRSFASISCWGETMTPIAFEVKDFLKQRIPWDYFVLNPVSWWLLGCVFLVPLVGLLRTDVTKQVEFVIGLLVLVAIFGFHRWMNFGLVLRRHHEGGFLRRNGEAIALAAISALVGAIIAIIMQQAVGTSATNQPAATSSPQSTPTTTPSHP